MPAEPTYPMRDRVSEEWERAVKHLFEVSIPKALP